MEITIYFMLTKLSLFIIVTLMTKKSILEFFHIITFDEKNNLDS